MISKESFTQIKRFVVQYESKFVFMHVSTFKFSLPNLKIKFARFCLHVSCVRFKVVICGKYKNLNKITKTLHISLKFNRLLILCYSLQFTMQNRGTCCLKRCFNSERSKRTFVRENLKK